MLNNYKEIKQFVSTTKKVALVKYNNKDAILKLFDTEEEAQTEAEMIKKISITGYAPTLYEINKNYLICEYFEGVSFRDAFKYATLSDDVEQMQHLAKILSILIQMIRSMCDGMCFEKVDFNNFIIQNDRCICVSFAHFVTDRPPYYDIACIIAYALTNACGEFYSCFPFVEKFVKCFHLSIMDVVNDIRIALEDIDDNMCDKTLILDALIDYFDKGTSYKLLYN